MDIAVVGFKFTYSVSEKNKVINPYDQKRLQTAKT